jgi:hypothetical protein
MNLYDGSLINLYAAAEGLGADALSIFIKGERVDEA